MNTGEIQSLVLQGSSGYVRKYFDVKKRAFVCNFMRDYGRLYAKFLFVNNSKNNRCEIRAFFLKNMRVFPIYCVESRIARP